jgi:hypothetical protein
VRIVARDGGVDADALVGRTVTLRVRPMPQGVEFVVELIPPVDELRAAELRTSAAR